MKPIFFTPGPGQLHPLVKTYTEQAFRENICSISHRSETFRSIYSQTIDALRELMNIPQNFQIFFLGSATEAMERIIQNCVQHNSLHFVNGSFSRRFYDTAVDLKKKASLIEAQYGAGFDFRTVTTDLPVELICITHNETSTGVALPMDEVYSLKKRFPGSLLAVDIVSSAPYIALDYNYVDCAFFSVQKGFGLPAGVGVMIINYSCLEKAQLLQCSNTNIGSYHNFLSLQKQAVNLQTPETPNVLGIYLLGKICEAYLDKGPHIIRFETDEKARLLYDFFIKNKQYQPFVANPKIRSRTVIVADVNGGSIPLIEKLSNHGYLVGAGYGPLKKQHIRIANFPMHTRDDVLKLIETMDI